MSYNAWMPWTDKTEEFKNHPLIPAGCKKAICNDLYAVQFYEQECEWGTVTHLAITSVHGKPIREWAHMQRIKNELVGRERLAIEMYPAESDVVDGANMYHVWVLPEGFKFPFDLKKWCAFQISTRIQRGIFK